MRPKELEGVGVGGNQRREYGRKEKELWIWNLWSSLDFVLLLSLAPGCVCPRSPGRFSYEGQYELLPCVALDT